MPATFSLKIDGVNELLKSFKGFEKETMNALNDTIEDVGKEGASIMKKEAPSATGELKESVDLKINKGSRTAQAVIEPKARYAKAVETGRDAGGMPPTDAIRRWLSAKGIAENKAFVIARAIGAGKTKANQPNPFVERTFDKIKSLFPSRLTRAINQAIRSSF